VAAQSKPKRRIRRDPETTRGLILNVTEKLMVEEGYAAVSSRRIAREIGLNAATVHYYYPATDDIFIDLHRRMTERQTEELQNVLASDNPLEAFWTFQSGWAQTALGVEFLALSNHRKAIRDTLARSTEEARAIQSCLLQRAFEKVPIEPAVLSPTALATILVAIGRLLANEERVGITKGHEEVRAFVDWALATLAGPDKPLRE
jgi:TetR/AcrR family transcriptional regulator, regulator of autoinduction and epiphytic fitness